MSQKVFAALDQLEDSFRKNLINSFTGFKSVSLIGTKSEDGLTNLAIFSQILHVGAHPPLIGILFRPHTVPRGTLENILNTQKLTIIHIKEEFYLEAHHTAARWDISEFQGCGLHEEYLDLHFAPFVKEASIKAAASYVEHTVIKANNTIFLVAQLEKIYTPEDSVGSDGFINLEKSGTITCSGLDSYHKTSFMGRLQYPKPQKKPEFIF